MQFTDVINQQFSMFSSVKDVAPVRKISLGEIVDLVKKGEAKSKHSLPLFTASSCGGRKKENAIPTGFVMVDLDHFGATDDDVRRAATMPFCVLAIKSPSGDGVKALCKVSAKNTDRSIFCCMWKYHEMFGLPIRKANKKASSAGIDRATLNSVQLTFIPQGRFMVIADDFIEAPCMEYTEAPSEDNTETYLVPAHPIADEGCGRHESYINAVANLHGATLEQVKAALPSRSSDSTELDRIYNGQQQHKANSWRGLIRDTPFDSYEECCRIVQARFMNEFRLSSEDRGCLYRLDGTEVPAAEARSMLELTTNSYSTAKGQLGTVNVERALANTGNYRHFAPTTIDFSKPRGLTSDGKINLRAPLAFEQPIEPDVDEQLMDKFIADYDHYFQSRTDAIAVCGGVHKVKETTLLAAFFSVLCDTANSHLRPCAVFIQGLQGSGKSTCGEDTARRLFGEKAFTVCQGWIGKSNFTTFGYENTRVVCIQEARPTSNDMPALKQALRSGDERIEYKGRTAKQVVTQHGFLMSTNDDFVPREITNDRGILIIGMDNVPEQPSDLVHDWISAGRCPWPYALAHRLKEYFDQMAGDATRYICIASSAPATSRRDQLNANKLADDKYVVTAINILRDEGRPLPAAELAQRMCESRTRLQVTDLSLGIRLKGAAANGMLVKERVHTETSTTTYWRLPDQTLETSNSENIAF